MEGETIAKSILKERFGLVAEKIPTSTESSPDFIIYFEGKELAVCEVKDIEIVEPSEANGWKKLVTGFFTRPDNAPQKIRTKIYEAHKQLKKYDLPKILLFVNFYNLCDINDLMQAVLGGLAYKGVDGEQVFLRDGSDESLKRIEPIMREIDLYLWLDHVRGDELYIRRFPDNSKAEALIRHFLQDS